MAEKQEVSSGSAPPRCANGCGFFVNAGTKNFCSWCYQVMVVAPIEAATEVTTAAAEKQEEEAPAAGEATTAVTEKQEEEAPAPILCARGCGFFTSTATDNMCTYCHADSINAVDATPELLEKIKASKAALAALTVTEEQPVPAAEEAAPAVEAPIRCQACRKKVGPVGFPCRCGGTFCKRHRFADEHACDFDFKNAGRETIAKNNPLIVAPKINKM